MTRFLRWIPADRFDCGVSAAPLIPAHDPPLQPRDEAIFLLRLAAEVEHALLVQYLFALYSVRLEGFTGSNVPANADLLCNDWREAIKVIALQEMGHLMTVQNLLLFLGAPVHFDRPVFPHASPFYPFEFALEKLSKDSLAKYVVAEMPLIVPDALLREIILRARGASGGQFVNRVGALYSAIGRLFEPGGGLTDRDCDFDSIDYQADAQHWSGQPPDFLLPTICSRQQAASALRDVAEQGEGPTSPAPDDSPSHFSTFRQIYFNSNDPGASFPETDSILAPIEWNATLPVIRNPIVSETVTSNASQNIVRDPFAAKWCQLFNSRYRMLPACLAHYLHESGNSLERQQLVNKATFEMKVLARAAKVLMELPAGAQQSGNAGPPFEIDYDLTMPPGSANRWRLQRDVLLASRSVILELRLFSLSSEQTTLLDALDRNDDDFLTFVDQQLP